jgi:hypothetical protein
MAAAGVALTLTCGGKVSTRPALKTCILSDRREMSGSLAGRIALGREDA